MSDKPTRTNLEKAGKGKTDWDALARLDDIRISVRALEEEDTILPDPEELAAVSRATEVESAILFEIRHLPDGTYRWRLTSVDGTEFAIGPESFETRQQAIASVRSFLHALGKVTQLAA